MTKANNVLRNIPSVSELLESPPLRGLVDRVSHNVVVTGVRAFLDTLRRDMQSAAAEIRVPNVGELAEKIAEWIVRDDKPPLRPVINATGIILHTGLGRAPLAAEALRAIAEIGGGYASLEVDVESGERSQRVLAVDKLLRQLTGAEAAAVVNNNAAATLLTLAARGKRPGGDRFPRPTDRDRRQLPTARSDVGERGNPARGGHHEQDTFPRLRSRDQPADRRTAARPHQQFPGGRIHRRSVAGGTGPARPQTPAPRG